MARAAGRTPDVQGSRSKCQGRISAEALGRSGGSLARSLLWATWSGGLGLGSAHRCFDSRMGFHRHQDLTECRLLISNLFKRVQGSVLV